MSVCVGYVRRLFLGQKKRGKIFGSVKIGRGKRNIRKGTVMRVISQVPAFVKVAAQNGTGLMPIGGDPLADPVGRDPAIHLPAILVRLHADVKPLNLLRRDHGRPGSVVAQGGVDRAVGIDLDIDVAGIRFGGILHEDLHAAVLANGGVVLGLHGAEILLVGTEVKAERVLRPGDGYLRFGRCRIIFDPREMGKAEQTAAFFDRIHQLPP